ncbi:MAG: hypothetical protein ACYC9S_00605 [Leptospirales bacterium]
MIFPFRTRFTILLVTFPGLLDMFWIFERFLGLPVRYRHPGLIAPEAMLLVVFLGLIMWSFVVRWLAKKETVILLSVSVGMAIAGFLRLFWIVWSPLSDPLLKPHLFEVGGLVSGALILGIEAESGRRYFIRKEQKERDEASNSPRSPQPLTGQRR